MGHYMPGRPLKSPSARPLRLRGLLHSRRIPHAQFADLLGINVHHFSHLICRDTWPSNKPREEVKALVNARLIELGIPQSEIETAWDRAEPAASQGDPSNPSAGPAGKHAPADDFQLPEAEMLSPEARELFQLARHPFIDDVQGPADVFLSKEQRYVRDSMYYAAKHGGFVAVVGESGSGKSTLRRDLMERVRRDGEPIVVIQPQAIDKKELTATHICDAIIADLSQETPKLSLEAKARQISRILTGSARAGNLHVLMIEEAHDLSTPTLKYLKRFWELEDGFKKLIGIILIGQPELGDRLDERRNYEAREVIRRCEIARLRPLNGNLGEYLALKFSRVGVSAEAVFEPGALDAIKARLTRRRMGSNDVESHLYPLVVQNLVVKCMNLCAELGLTRVSAEVVGKV